MPHFNQQFVYLAVYRGILVNIELDRATAESQLHGVSFERLILWYHHLHGKRVDEQREHLLQVYHLAHLRHAVSIGRISLESGIDFTSVFFDNAR